MSKKIVNTENAPSPVGPYNQSVVAAGQMVFVSGQIALDPQSGSLVMGSIEEETDQVMQNVQAVLHANNCTMDDVVNCFVFVKDMDHYGQINKVYGSYFDESTAPTRALVEVGRLPKDVRVEISAIAVKKG